MSKKRDENIPETMKREGRKLTLSRETIRSLKVHSSIRTGARKRPLDTEAPNGCDFLTTR